MRTKDEILAKNLIALVGRTKESYASIDEMKKQPEWEATINAMEEYALELKLFAIPDVSNCYSKKDVEDAYNKGYGQGKYCPDFDE